MSVAGLELGVIMCIIITWCSGILHSDWSITTFCSCFSKSYIYLFALIYVYKCSTKASLFFSDSDSYELVSVESRMLWVVLCSVIEGLCSV